ncbi:Receptor-like cytosolic serine/threonine-protein kinase [Arachis hypogaea]|nr:Receptor-like cytosolic serine/threonine-protein kinase [Arachis hypogaea]
MVILTQMLVIPSGSNKVTQSLDEQENQGVVQRKNLPRLSSLPRLFRVKLLLLLLLLQRLRVETRDGVTVTERGREQISRASSSRTIEKTRRPPSKSRASSSSSPPPPSPPPRHPVHVFNPKIDEGRKALRVLSLLLFIFLCAGAVEFIICHAEISIAFVEEKKIPEHLWLVLRYAILNVEVIQAAISLAKQEGLLVSLDLASFEKVRKFKPPLMKLLESGNIDLFDSAVNCLLFCIDHLENMTNYTIMGILINGQFPGPTIDAVTNDLKTPGDELEVNLKSWAVSSISSFQNIYFLELGIMAHVSHTNTAKLVGYGVEGGMHLVLELSENGSLASVLYGFKEKLPWSIRQRIALGTAEGILYLNEAKWLPENWNHRVTRFEGTFGYLALEYLLHGLVDEKIDVFCLVI